MVAERAGARPSGRDAVGAVSRLVDDVGQALRRLRDELTAPPTD